MGKLTRFQRQVAERLGKHPTKEHIHLVAAEYGTSLGQILKALKASGGSLGRPEVTNATDDCHTEPLHFETTGDGSVKDAWFDGFGGLWLESNDKERVVIPRTELQRFLGLFR